MQWLPDTIDALARLYDKTGIWGFIISGLIIAGLIIAWRHANAVLLAVQTFLDHKQSDTAARVQTNLELSAQTLVLESIATNTETNGNNIARLADKLGPDAGKICRSGEVEKLLHIWLEKSEAKEAALNIAAAASAAAAKISEAASAASAATQKVSELSQVEFRHNEKNKQQAESNRAEIERLKAERTTHAP